MLELLPLVTYLLVMYSTPGPNNIMLAASGVNFGFRRTLPHMAGVCFGNAMQVLFCALLLTSAVGLIDQLRQPLAVVGCLYLFWLSWKIARAGEPGKGKRGKGDAKPMSFIGAALFQNVNPKAWVTVANTSLLFMPPGGSLTAALGLTLTSILVGIPSVSIWAWSGDRLRRWLHQPLALRLFNLGMATLLAGTAAWLLADEMKVI